MQRLRLRSPSPRRQINAIRLFVSLLALAGCGGGGGGGGEPPLLPPTTFTVGGTVTGLSGAGLILQLNGGENLGVSANGGFTFTAQLATGSAYSVGVLTQPTNPSQTCTVTNGSGTVGTSNVTNVSVACVLSDPLYSDQWHLKNTGQAGGTVGEDANVEPVWNAGRKGDGVRIAIVDDGVEIAHEDLSANVVAGASHNYVDGGTDPTGGDHGTAVAGVAAARDLNGVGVRGAASRASLVGYNLLQDFTDVNVVDSMIRDRVANAISSNSWGPPDGHGTLDAPAASWFSAIETGLAEGRDGKGLIYTWAAGNGAPTDNSNYDGQANYRGVIAVAALRNDGVKASYSEPGANVWISAPAGEFCDTHAITTTDRTGEEGLNHSATTNDYPNKNYTKCFNGTSSATPLVSGVVGLMLQANPNLGWRDVRLILAETARKNDPGDPDWAVNGAGLNINHKYGFGAVDAEAAVNRALTWTNVEPHATPVDMTQLVNVAIPDGLAAGVFGGPVSSSITVPAGITSIEFVEVTFVSNHTYHGDLEIVLTRAGGSGVTTSSRLAEQHLCTPGLCPASFSSPGWRFGSARHLGEPAEGTWTLTVRDGFPADTGTFQSWNLKIYGR